MGHLSDNETSPAQVLKKGEEKIELVLEEHYDDQLELSDYLEAWTLAVLLQVSSIMKSIGDD